MVDTGIAVREYFPVPANGSRRRVSWGRNGGDIVVVAGVASAVQMSWGEPNVCCKPTSQGEQLPGVKDATPQKVGNNPLGNWKRVVQALSSVRGGSTEPSWGGGGTGVMVPCTA